MSSNLKVVDITPALQAVDVPLEDGTAEHMGNGTFIIFQQDEYGEPQSVVLTEEDMRRMLASLPR